MRVLPTLIFLVCLTLCQHAVEAKKPNIMVFLVDDMGVMDTSVPFLTDPQGNPKRYPLNDFYRTPSMERLAAQGMRFSTFYAMSVCSPTRISIMTGQNAARHGSTNWINPRNDNRGPHGPPDWDWKGLKKGEVTLAGQLREAGYRTIHVGKAHFGPHGQDGEEPLHLGFDVNVGGAAFGAPGSYYAEKKYGLETNRAHHAVPHLDAYHGSDTFLTEALTIEAKKQVEAAVQAEQPFFLHFSHYAVHGPFDSDPRFAAHYRDSGKPPAAQAFATLIEGMDKSLGDMIDHMQALGIAEETLVLFLGDNGTDAPLGHQHEVACAAPLRGRKGAHYEGGMRVPFIAAWAKPSQANPLQANLPIPQGTIQSQMASVLDLFPTVLKLAGGEAPQDHIVDGQALQPLLAGTADPVRPQHFLMHYPHGPHRSHYFTVWREGDWKVIHHALPKLAAKGNRLQSDGGGPYELFNLSIDPFESTNVARDEPATLKRMVKGLREALRAHQALYPIDADGKELIPPLP